jgi:hypothetical protein
MCDTETGTAAAAAAAAAAAEMLIPPREGEM